MPIQFTPRADGCIPDACPDWDVCAVCGEVIDYYDGKQRVEDPMSLHRFRHGSEGCPRDRK